MQLIAERFAGRQAALVVGIGFSVLVVSGFLIVVGFSFAMSWLTDRPPAPRKHKTRRDNDT